MIRQAGTRHIDSEIHQKDDIVAYQQEGTTSSIQSTKFGPVKSYGNENDNPNKTSALGGRHRRQLSDSTHDTDITDQDDANRKEFSEEYCPSNPYTSSIPGLVSSVSSSGGAVASFAKDLPPSLTLVDSLITNQSFDTDENLTTTNECVHSDETKSQVRSCTSSLMRQQPLLSKNREVLRSLLNDKEEARQQEQERRDKTPAIIREFEGIIGELLQWIVSKKVNLFKHEDSMQQPFEEPSSTSNPLFVFWSASTAFTVIAIIGIAIYTQQAHILHGISLLLLYHMNNILRPWYRYHTNVPENNVAYKRFRNFWRRLQKSCEKFCKTGKFSTELIGTVIFLWDFTSRPGASYFFWIIRYCTSFMNFRTMNNLDDARSRYQTVHERMSRYQNPAKPTETDPVSEKLPRPLPSRASGIRRIFTPSTSDNDQNDHVD